MKEKAQGREDHVGRGKACEAGGRIKFEFGKKTKGKKTKTNKANKRKRISRWG